MTFLHRILLPLLLLALGCPPSLGDGDAVATDDDTAPDDDSISDDDTSGDDDDTPVNPNTAALVSDASWTVTGNALPPGWFSGGDPGPSGVTVPSPDGCGVVLDATSLGREPMEHEIVGTRAMWGSNPGGTTYFRRSVAIPASATDIAGAITIVANDDLVFSVDGVTRAKDFATEGNLLVELMAADHFVAGAPNVMNLRGEDLYGGCGFVLVSGVVSWQGPEAGTVEIRSDDEGFTVVDQVATPPRWVEGVVGDAVDVGGKLSCGWTWDDSLGRPLEAWEHASVLPMSTLVERGEAYYVREVILPDSAWDVRLQLSIVADDDAQIAINGAPILLDMDGGVAGIDTLDVWGALTGGSNLITVRTQDTQGGCHWIALNGTVSWEP